MNTVTITVRERGKRVAIREGSNVWTEAGNTYLANLIACTSFSPFVPQRNDRLRYAGLGIGSVRQAHPAVNSAPFTTYYPAGADPHATNGHRYNKDYPIEPAIGTLERPIKCQGIASSYSAPDPADEYLIANSFPTHPSLTSFSLHSTIDAGAGDVLLGTFTFVPVSEIGLFTSAATVSSPFNPAMAYYSFDMLQINPTSVIDVVWTVRF